MKTVSDCKIVFNGLSSGKHSFTFELGDMFFNLFEGTEIEHGKLFVTVVMDKQPLLLQLFVNITGTVQTACDRCLDSLELPVEFEGEVSVRFGLAAEAENNDDVIMLDPAENKLDLSQYFYDNINLSLPLQRIHPEGKCDPEMIQKLQSFVINK